jgi:hypothetical protein
MGSEGLLASLQIHTSFSEALPMPRITLIPTRTADGRHIIFKARVESNRERIIAAVRHALGRGRPVFQGS